MKKEAIIGIVLIVAVLVISGCVSKTVKEECPDVKCPIVKCSEPETKTETITKYVCENKSIVDDSVKCISTYTPTKLSPIETNEIGTYIESVEVSPSCVSGNDGVKILFKTKTFPDKVEYQISENGVDYTSKFILKGITTDYNYIAICKGRCHDGDFQIEPGKQYLLRLKFDFTSILGKIQYSNEHLVDTSEGSEYTVKVCGSE